MLACMPVVTPCFVVERVNWGFRVYHRVGGLVERLLAARFALEAILY